MTEQTIVWRTIEEYPSYSVSSAGEVRNDETGRILSPGKGKNGYFTVTLCKDNKSKSQLVHRLVALHFIPNPGSKRCVDHSDGNPLNNKIENLRWATHRENCANSKMQSNNTSGIKGVHWYKRDSKWQVYIRIEGVSTHLGYFATLEEATSVRRAAAQEHFGEFCHSSEKN